MKLLINEALTNCLSWAKHSYYCGWLPLILICLGCISNKQQVKAYSLQPEEVVRAFYNYHFSHDMAFTESSVNAKKTWLTSDLYKKVTAKIRQPVPKDTIPDIDGDPFTDSQEYPKSFKVKESSLNGGKAVVTVEFSWNDNKRSLSVALLHQKNEWKIDDIIYKPNDTLRKLLSQ